MRDRFLRSTNDCDRCGRSLRCGFRIDHRNVGCRPPAPSPKTPWGEPDSSGIWTDERHALQRSPKFANQEFFTEAPARRIGSASGSAMQGRENAPSAVRLPTLQCV